MIFKKPRFWDRRIGLISILLLPLTLIVLLLIFFKKKLIKTIKFKIPVICVGNIYVGGTGKTPTSIFLASELNKKGYDPVILRKYYKSHKDEYKLIKNNYKNLIVSNNRVDGIKNLQNSDFDSVILDDGFQDYSIKKDLNIICFNSRQLIGNGMVLPSGPLRENLNALKKANIVLINGEKNTKFEDKIYKINNKIEIFYSNYKPTNLLEFNDKDLFAIAGIGNPSNFFEILEKNKLNIKKKIIFPDHYNISKIQIEKIIEEAAEKKLQVIMTEKDYYKIEKYNISNIKCLKVELDIINKEKFLRRISEIYI